jgi:glycosyltransferase involved in cell wall biosynthesis
MKAVHRFLLTSEGSREMLAQLGLPLSDYDVIPNFLPDSAFVSRSRANRGQYALFAGRLSEEKGADTAIEACSRAGVPLAIAGEGPDEPRLRSLAAASKSQVEFLGHVDPAGMPAIRQGAGLALVPSRWHEPHPYAVSEAMAAGVPVLVSNLGGLPEMAGSEATLEAADPGTWADAVGELWGDRKLRRRRGEEAIDRARERFSADSYYERLMACYRAARS